MGKKSRPLPAGDPDDPRGLVALMGRYLEALRVANHSPATLVSRHFHLEKFLLWGEDRGVFHAVEVTKALLERYRRSLYRYEQASGEPLSVSTRAGRLVVIRCFFRWLAREDLILVNPAADLELPKRGASLPLDVLTAAEAETVLAQPDVTGAIGLRDRALLETLYSTAIRRQELRALGLYDLNAERGTLLVRQGKGKRDRVVPIGARALSWLQRYLDTVRPGLVQEPAAPFLFLTQTGAPLGLSTLVAIARRYLVAAGLGTRRGACHLFRHTAATLMLENGADIRFIQQLLGHTDLASTQIYTRVSIRQLKEVHTRTHPARLPEPGEAAAAAGGAAADGGESRPTPAEPLP